jgi:hypothetical protein
MLLGRSQLAGTKDGQEICLPLMVRAPLAINDPLTIRAPLMIQIREDEEVLFTAWCGCSRCSCGEFLTSVHVDDAGVLFGRAL